MIIFLKKLNLTIFIDDVEVVKRIYDSSTNLVPELYNLMINFLVRHKLLN